jgi:hypothetical protein
MPWFRVDDNLGFHHKVIAAGNPAMGLWVRAGSVCASQLTDGFVPDHMIASLGTIAQAKRLVEVGLWSRTEGGYRFHEWDERQPRRADVEAERAAAKERMRAARERKRKAAQEASPQVDGVRSADVRANTSRSSGEVREVFGDPNPTLPIPTRPDPPKVADSADAPSGRALALVGSDDHAPTAQTLVAEWIDHCPERPPGRVIGQVSKELKGLLDEGIDPERVRRALAEWNRKGLHPSTLPSVVHEIGNRAPTKTNRQAAEDAMWERAMDRAIEREREMGLRP